MAFYLSPPPGNFLSRIIAAIVGVLLLVGAFFIGFAALIVLLGVSLLGGIWVGFKSWQHNRQHPQSQSGSANQQTAGPERQNTSSGDVLDGEYQVISREEQR